MPLRYAILHHTGIAEPHFDLLFETYEGSALAAWRSASWPIAPPAGLTRLADHRPVYLDFEGELSGRRGRVERVAGGHCAVEVSAGGDWTIRLVSGAGPAADFHLRHIADDRWEAMSPAA